ncbi:MAG: hypothetical protein OQL28_11410, partial [Sedimenticola sp.]|nr:hypothetical protein [Sedimenticola sp.]
MDKDHSYSPPRRYRRHGIWFLVLLGLVLVLWQTAHWSRQLALETLQQQSQHQLRLFVANLEGQL